MISFCFLKLVFFFSNSAKTKTTHCPIVIGREKKGMLITTFQEGFSPLVCKMVHKHIGPKGMMNLYKDKHIEYFVEDEKDQHRCQWRHPDEVNNTTKDEVRSAIFFSRQTIKSLIKRPKKQSRSLIDAEAKKHVVRDPLQTRLFRSTEGDSQTQMLFVENKKRTHEENSKLVSIEEGHERLRVEMKKGKKRDLLAMSASNLSEYRTQVHCMLEIKVCDRASVTRILRATTEIPSLYDISAQDKIAYTISKCPFYYCLTAKPNPAEEIDALLQDGRLPNLHGCTTNAVFIMNMFLRNELNREILKSQSLRGELSRGEIIQSNCYILYASEDEDKLCEITGFEWERDATGKYLLHARKLPNMYFPANCFSVDYAITIPMEEKDKKLFRTLENLIKIIAKKQ